MRYGDFSSLILLKATDDHCVNILLPFSSIITNYEPHHFPLRVTCYTLIGQENNNTLDKKNKKKPSLNKVVYMLVMLFWNKSITCVLFSLSSSHLPNSNVFHI